MRLLLTILMLTLALPAFAQRPNDDYVTAEDIQIRFPGAQTPGEDGWYSPTVISIEYSIEPVVTVHRTKAKLGLQNWEFTLQQNMIAYEKCVITIDVPAIPDGFRIMELRVRVRGDDTVDVTIGPWSASNSVKIIGKPGNLFLQ